MKDPKEPVRHWASNPSAKAVVKPRKRTTNADRPVIALSVALDSYVTEEGETGTLEELSPLLRTLPLSILTCDHSAEFLAWMDGRWKADPAWQFGILPIKRELFMPRARPGVVVTQKSTAVNFMGWRNEGARAGGRSGKLRNHYHLCIDPITFSSFPLASAGQEHQLFTLLAWGQELRAFCVGEGINLKPTQGGTARQFLRDERFYPDPRRKVPRATNESVREFLPGNCYEVRASPEYEYEALYIDQTKAHHYHTQATTFPHADTLYCYGRFRGREKGWRDTPERVTSFLEHFHGLIYGRLKYDPRPHRFTPPYLTNLDKPVAWYTCELPLLQSLGVEVVDIVGAWGGSELDTGMNTYAEFAINRLGPEPPMWMKTLMLSTYGTLATRARATEFGFAKAVRGAERVIRAGSETFTAKILTPSREGEPSTNNVLHRGIIEAATRTESLMFANYLQHHGHRVLCIYVDAVIVETNGRPLPLVPDPWRTKTVLHNLKFISSNAFQSDEMTKIPGGLQRSEALALRPRQERGRLRYGVQNPHARPHRRSAHRTPV